MLSRKNTSFLFVLLTLLACHSLFQSCGREKLDDINANFVETRAAQPSGTGGFDGKVYISYGKCAGSFKVSSVIETAKDYSSAVYTRHNCNDLSSPEPIDMTTVTLDETHDVLSVEGRVYDLETGASDIVVTTRFCEGVIDGTRTAVTATVVWTGTSSTQIQQLTGTVSLSNGASTGPLDLVVGDDVFRSTDMQSSTMALDQGMPADLEFSINGGRVITVENMNCSSQEYD